MDTLTETQADILTAARCVVLKIGSALLVDPETGALRESWLAALAEDIARLRQEGRSVVIVSSGAIALGRHVLDIGSPVLSLEESQAAAAIGQTRLVRAWEDALSRHGLRTAQVLVTLEDTQKRRRYLNGRTTLATLLAHDAIPVVNENDTVATDEIRYGDNDRLAARVALMAGADALVLLSDVDGLYTSNPRDDRAARHIPVIHEITPEIEAMAGGTGTAGAKGGMKTKIQAAKTAMQGGCAMAVCMGDLMHPIRALFDGGRATWFLPVQAPSAARKQWIAGMKPLGHLVVDAGAVKALRRGKSLLPAGVRSVEGAFERGDPVAILDEAGDAVGAALSAYGNRDAASIAGLHTDAISERLGYPGRSAMVHADDLVIWRK